MPDLQDSRRKIRMTMIGMGVACVLALGVLFSPLIGSTDSRRQQMQRLFEELKAKNQQVEPLRGIDKKVVVAKDQIGDFYKDRLPARDSAIYEELGKIQTQTGARIVGVKYKAEDPEPIGLQRVLIEAELAGDYVQLAKFVNALERDRMFFIVNSVTLGSEQGQNVKLSIRLETYLRTGAA